MRRALKTASLLSLAMLLPTSLSAQTSPAATPEVSQISTHLGTMTASFVAELEEGGTLLPEPGGATPLKTTLLCLGADGSKQAEERDRFLRRPATVLQSKQHQAGTGSSIATALACRRIRCCLAIFASRCSQASGVF